MIRAQSSYEYGPGGSPQADSRMNSITSSATTGTKALSDREAVAALARDARHGAAGGTSQSRPNMPQASVAQLIDLLEKHFGLLLGSNSSSAALSVQTGAGILPFQQQQQQQPGQQVITSPTTNLAPGQAIDLYGESTIFRDGIVNKDRFPQQTGSALPTSGGSSYATLSYQPRPSTPNTPDVMASPLTKIVGGFPTSGANGMQGVGASPSRSGGDTVALATMRPSRFLQQAYRAPLRLSRELQARKDAGVLLSSNLRGYCANPDQTLMATYNVHTVSVPRHYAENCLPHIISGISSSIFGAARPDGEAGPANLIADRPGQTAGKEGGLVVGQGGGGLGVHAGSPMGIATGTVLWMSHMLDSANTTPAERLHESILFSLRRITHFHFQTLLMGHAALLPPDNDFGLSPSRLALTCGGDDCVRNLVHGPQEQCDTIPFMMAAEYSNISARVMPLLQSSLPATVNAGLAAMKHFVELSNQSTATESVSASTSAAARPSVGSAGLMFVRDAASYHNLLLQLFPTLIRFEAHEVLLRLITICAPWRFAEQSTRAGFLFHFIRACLPSDYAPLVELALRAWRTVYDCCVKADGVCPAIRDVELRDKAVEWLMLDTPPSHIAMAKNCGKTITSLLIFRHLMAVAPFQFLNSMLAIQPKSAFSAVLNAKTLQAMVDSGKALVANKDALDSEYDFSSVTNVSNHFFSIIWFALKDARSPKVRDLAAETLLRALLLLVSEVSDINGLTIVLEAVLHPFAAQAVGLIEGRTVPVLAVGPLGPVIDAGRLISSHHLNGAAAGNDNSGEESDSDSEEANSPTVRNSASSRAKSGYGSGSSQGSKSNRSYRSRASSAAARSNATRVTMVSSGSGGKIPITDATFHAGTLVLGAVVAAYKLIVQRIASHASATSQPSRGPEHTVLSPHVLPSVLSVHHGNPSVLSQGPPVTSTLGFEDAVNNDSVGPLTALNYASRTRPLPTSAYIDGTAPPSMLNNPALMITVSDGHTTGDLGQPATKPSIGNLFSDYQMRTVLNAILAHNQKLASQTRLSGIRLLPLMVGVQPQFFSERVPPENFCLEGLLTAVVRNLELSQSSSQRYHYLAAAAATYSLHPHHANPKLYALSQNDKLVSHLFRLLVGKGRLDLALLPICWFVESADPASKSFLTRHILAQLQNLFADSPMTPEFAAGLQRLCIAEATILPSVQTKLIERIEDELKLKDSADRSSAFGVTGIGFLEQHKHRMAAMAEHGGGRPGSPTSSQQQQSGKMGPGDGVSKNINLAVAAIKAHGWNETATSIETKLNCFRILQYLKVQWLGSSNFFTSVCLPYFNHPSPLLRLECVKSCLRVVFNEGALSSTNPRILGLLTAHLATSALTDMSEEIRFTALITLTDPRMSDHLYQSQQVLDILFALINDESPRIANLSIGMLRDISSLNPSGTLPRLRRALLQTLTEIQNAATFESASRGITDAKLEKVMNMMEAAPVASAFYLRFVVKVLNTVLLQIDIISPQAATVALKMLIFAFNLAAEDDWPLFLPFVDIILSFMEQTEKDLIRFPERFAQFKAFLLPALNALSCVTQASSGSEPVFDRIVPVLHRLLLLRSSNTDRELTMSVMKMVGAISSLDPMQTDLLALTENSGAAKSMAKLTSEKSIFFPKVEGVCHEVMHLLLQKLNTEHSSTEVYAFAFEALAVTICMKEIYRHRHSYFPSLATVLASAMTRSFTLRDRAFAFLTRVAPTVLDSPHPRDIRVLFALCRRHWNPNEPMIITRITRLIQILIVKMPTGLHDYKAWFTTSLLHVLTQYSAMPELREASMSCLRLLHTFNVPQQQDSMLFIVIPTLCNVIQIGATTAVKCQATQLLTLIVTRMTTAQLDSFIPRIVDTCVASLTSTIEHRKKTLAIIATAEAVENGAERVLSRTAAEAQQSLFYQKEWEAIQQQANQSKSGGGLFHRLLGKEKPAMPAPDNINSLKQAIMTRRHNVYRGRTKQEIRDILIEYKEAKSNVGGSRLCAMGLPASAAARITWVSRFEFDILSLSCAVATASCRQLCADSTSALSRGSSSKSGKPTLAGYPHIHHQDHLSLKSNGVFDAFFVTVVSAIKKRFCYTKENPFGPSFIAQVIASRTKSIAAASADASANSEKSFFGKDKKDKKRGSDTSSVAGSIAIGRLPPSTQETFAESDNNFQLGQTGTYGSAPTPFGLTSLSQEALQLSALEQSPVAIQFTQPEIYSHIIELLTKCKSCINEHRSDASSRVNLSSISETNKTNTSTIVDGYDVGDAVMIEVVRSHREHGQPPNNGLSQRSQGDSSAGKYRLSPMSGSTAAGIALSNSNSNAALQSPYSTTNSIANRTSTANVNVAIPKTRSERVADLASRVPRSAPIALPQRAVPGAAGSQTQLNNTLRGKELNNNASVVFRRRSVSTSVLPAATGYYVPVGSVLTANAMSASFGVVSAATPVNHQHDGERDVNTNRLLTLIEGYGTKATGSSSQNRARALSASARYTNNGSIVFAHPPSAAPPLNNNEGGSFSALPPPSIVSSSFPTDPPHSANDIVIAQTSFHEAPSSVYAPSNPSLPPRPTAASGAKLTGGVASSAAFASNVMLQRDASSYFGASYLYNPNSSLSGPSGGAAGRAAAAAFYQEAQEALKIWRSSAQNTSEEDWRRWIANLSLPLLKASPVECLRACYALAEVDFSTLCALFPALQLTMLHYLNKNVSYTVAGSHISEWCDEFGRFGALVAKHLEFDAVSSSTPQQLTTPSTNPYYSNFGESLGGGLTTFQNTAANSKSYANSCYGSVQQSPVLGARVGPTGAPPLLPFSVPATKRQSDMLPNFSPQQSAAAPSLSAPYNVGSVSVSGGLGGKPTSGAVTATTSARIGPITGSMLMSPFFAFAPAPNIDGLTSFPPAMTSVTTIPSVGYWPAHTQLMGSLNEPLGAVLEDSQSNSSYPSRTNQQLLSSGAAQTHVHHLHLPYDILAEIARSAHYIQCNTDVLGPYVHSVSKAVVAKLARGALLVPVAIYHLELLVADGDSHHAPALAEMYRQALLHDDSNTLKYVLDTLEQATHNNDVQGPKWLESIGRTEEAISAYVAKLSATTKAQSPRIPQSPTKVFGFGNQAELAGSMGSGFGFGPPNQFNEGTTGVSVVAIARPPLPTRQPNRGSISQSNNPASAPLSGGNEQQPSTSPGAINNMLSMSDAAVLLSDPNSPILSRTDSGDKKVTGNAGAVTGPASFLRLPPAGSVPPSPAVVARHGQTSSNFSGNDSLNNIPNTKGGTTTASPGRALQLDSTTENPNLRLPLVPAATYNNEIVVDGWSDKEIVLGLSRCYNSLMDFSAVLKLYRLARYHNSVANSAQAGIVRPSMMANPHNNNFSNFDDTLSVTPPARDLNPLSASCTVSPLMGAVSGFDHSGSTNNNSSGNPAVATSTRAVAHKHMNESTSTTVFHQAPSSPSLMRVASQIKIRPGRLFSIDASGGDGVVGGSEAQLAQSLGNVGGLGRSLTTRSTLGVPRDQKRLSMVSFSGKPAAAAVRATSSSASQHIFVSTSGRAHPIQSVPTSSGVVQKTLNSTLASQAAFAAVCLAQWDEVKDISRSVLLNRHSTLTSGKAGGGKSVFSRVASRFSEMETNSVSGGTLHRADTVNTLASKDAPTTEDENELLLQQFALTEVDDIHLFFGTAASFVASGNLGHANRLLQLVNDHLLDKIVLFRAQSEFQRLNLNSMFQRLFELTEGLQFLQISPSSTLRVNSIGQRMLPPQAPHRDVVSWVSYRSVLLPIHRQLVNIVSLTNRLLLDGYNERAVVGLSALSHYHPESPTLFTEAYRATIASLHDAPSLSALSTTLTETTDFTFDLLNVLTDGQCADEDARSLVVGGVTSELMEEYPTLDPSAMLKIMSIVNGKQVAVESSLGGSAPKASFVVPASTSLPSQRNHANSFSRPVNIAGLVRAELTLLKVACLDKLQSVQSSETLRARMESIFSRQRLAATYLHSKFVAGVRVTVLPPRASDEAVMIRYRLAEGAVETYMHSPPLFHELAMRLFDILEYIEDEIRSDPTANAEDVAGGKESDSGGDDDESESEPRNGKKINSKLRDMATQVVGALSKVIRFGTANYLSHPYFTSYTAVSSAGSGAPGKKPEAYYANPLAALKLCEDAQKDALFLQYIRDFSGSRRVVCAQKITQLNHALLKMVHVSVSILGSYKVIDFANAPIHLWCAAGPVWVNMAVNNPKILERLRIMCVQSIPFLRFMVYHLVSYFDKKPKPASPTGIGSKQTTDDAALSATSTPQHTFMTPGHYFSPDKRVSTSTTATTRTAVLSNASMGHNELGPITRTYTTNPQGTIYPRNSPARGQSNDTDTAPNTSGSPDLRPPPNHNAHEDSSSGNTNTTEKLFDFGGGGKSDPFPISPSASSLNTDGAPLARSARQPDDAALSSYLSGTFTNMSDQHFTGSRPGSLPRSLPLAKVPSQPRRAVSASAMATNTASNRESSTRSNTNTATGTTTAVEKAFLKPPIPNTRSLNSLGTSPSMSGTNVDDGVLPLAVDMTDNDTEAPFVHPTKSDSQTQAGAEPSITLASGFQSSSLNAIQVQSINEIDRDALFALTSKAAQNNASSTRSEVATSSDNNSGNYGKVMRMAADDFRQQQFVIGEDKIMTTPLPLRSELIRKPRPGRSRSVDATPIAAPLAPQNAGLTLSNRGRSAWAASPDHARSTTASPQGAAASKVADLPSLSSDDEDYVSVSDSDDDTAKKTGPLTRRGTFVYSSNANSKDTRPEGPKDSIYNAPVSNNSFSFQPARSSRQPSQHFAPDISPASYHQRSKAIPLSGSLRTRSGFIANAVGGSSPTPTHLEPRMSVTPQPAVSASATYKPAPPRKLHRFLAAIAHSSKAHRHIVQDVLTMGRFVASNGLSVTLKDSRCPAPQSLSQLSMAVVSGAIGTSYSAHEDRNASRPGNDASAAGPTGNVVDPSNPDDLGPVLTPSEEVLKDRPANEPIREDHRSELSRLAADASLGHNHHSQHIKRHQPHSYGSPNVLQVTRRVISNDGTSEVLPSMCNREEQLVRMFLTDGTTITFMLNIREDCLVSMGNNKSSASVSAQSAYLDNLKRHKDHQLAHDEAFVGHASPPATAASPSPGIDVDRQQTVASIPSTTTLSSSPLSPYQKVSPKKNSSDEIAGANPNASISTKAKMTEHIIQTLFGGGELVPLRGTRTVTYSKERRGSSQGTTPPTGFDVNSPSGMYPAGGESPVSLQLSQRTTSNASGKPTVRRSSSSTSGQSQFSRQHTPAAKKKRASTASQAPSNDPSGGANSSSNGYRISYSTLTLTATKDDGDSNQTVSECKDLRQRLGAVSALRESIFNVLIQSMPLMHTRRAMRVPISNTLILLQCHVEPMRRFPSKFGAQQPVALAARGVSAPPSLYHIVAAHHEATAATNSSVGNLNQSLFISRVAIQLLRVHRQRTAKSNCQTQHQQRSPQGVDRVASAGSDVSGFAPLGSHHLGGGVAYVNSQRTRSFNRTPSGGEVSGEHYIYNSLTGAAGNTVGSPGHTFSTVPVMSVPNSPGGLGALSPMSRSRPHSPLRRERRTVIHNGSTVPTSLFETVGNSGLNSGNMTPTASPLYPTAAQSTYDSSVTSPAGPLGSIATNAYMMSSTGAGRASSNAYLPANSDTSSNNANQPMGGRSVSTTLRPVPSGANSNDTAGDAIITTVGSLSSENNTHNKTTTAISSATGSGLPSKSDNAASQVQHVSALAALGIGASTTASASSQPQPITGNMFYQPPGSHHHQREYSAAHSFRPQQQQQSSLPPEQWVSPFDQFATASQKYLNTYSVHISSYTEDLADVERQTAATAHNRYESAFYTGGKGETEAEKTVPYGYGNTGGNDNNSWPYGSAEYTGKQASTDEELARVARKYPKLRLLSKRTVLSSDPNANGTTGVNSDGAPGDCPDSTRKGSEEANTQSASFASEGMLGGTHNSIAQPSIEHSHARQEPINKRPSEASTVTTGVPMNNNSVSGLFNFTSLAGNMQLSTVVEGVVAVTDSDSDIENVVDIQVGGSSSLPSKLLTQQQSPDGTANSSSPSMVGRTATRKPPLGGAFTPIMSGSNPDSSSTNICVAASTKPSSPTIKRRGRDSMAIPSASVVPSNERIHPAISIDSSCIMNTGAEPAIYDEDGPSFPTHSATATVAPTASPTTPPQGPAEENASVTLTKQYQEIIRVYQQLVKLERITAIEKERSMTNSTNALQEKFLADASCFSDWLAARANYAQQLAEWSILQYLFGVDIGSRDPSRIVVDTATGNISHLDFGSFALLPTPEDCFSFKPLLGDNQRATTLHGGTSYLGESTLLYGLSPLHLSTKTENINDGSKSTLRKSSMDPSANASLEVTPERLDATARFNSARELLKKVSAETTPTMNTAYDHVDTKKVVSAVSSPRGPGPADFSKAADAVHSKDHLVGYKLSKTLRMMMLPSLPAAHVGVNNSPIPFRLTPLLTNALPLRSPFGAFATHAAALLTATWGMAEDIEGIAQYGLAPMIKSTILYQQREIVVHNAMPALDTNAHSQQRRDSNTVGFHHHPTVGIPATTNERPPLTPTNQGPTMFIPTPLSHPDALTPETTELPSHSRSSHRTSGTARPASSGNASAGKMSSPLETTNAECEQLTNTNYPKVVLEDQQLMSATACLASCTAAIGESPMRNSTPIGHVTNRVTYAGDLAPLDLGGSVNTQSGSTFGFFSPDRQFGLDSGKFPTIGISLTPPAMVTPESVLTLNSAETANYASLRSRHSAAESITVPQLSSHSQAANDISDQDGAYADHQTTLAAATATLETEVSSTPLQIFTAVVSIPAKLKFFDVTAFSLKLRMCLPLEQRGNLPFTFVAPASATNNNEGPTSPTGSLNGSGAVGHRHSSLTSGINPPSVAAPGAHRGSDSSTIAASHPPPSPAIAGSKTERLYESQRHVLDAVRNNPSGRKWNAIETGSDVNPAADAPTDAFGTASSAPPTPPSNNSNAAQAFNDACNQFGSAHQAERTASDAAVDDQPAATGSAPLTGPLWTTAEGPLPLQPFPQFTISANSDGSMVASTPKPQTAQQLVRLLLEAATNPHLIAVADWGPEPSPGWWDTWAPHW